MAKMDKDDLKYVIGRSRKLFKGEEIPKVHGYEGEVEELIIRQCSALSGDPCGFYRAASAVAWTHRIHLLRTPGPRETVAARQHRRRPR